MRIFIKILAAHHFNLDKITFLSQGDVLRTEFLPTIAIVLRCDVSPLEECVRVYRHGTQLLADVGSWALQKGYLKRAYRCSNEQVFKIPLPTHS